ncbi:unnamed protein product [Closterium sp. Yama58-4]|nr:unnamed protein product [Closterium sp. Yama58-4]
MKAFSLSKKKTPFQKHREEEAKKKREAEEAARVYDEFVESFKVDDKKPKAFVRGGTINPNAKHDTPGEEPGSASKKATARYVPSFLPPPSQSPLAGILSKDKNPFGVEEPEKPAEPVPKAKEQKKPRNIDFFMQELKQEQELREQREKELKERAESRAAGKPYGNEGQPSLLGSEGTDLLQPFPDGVRRRVSIGVLCLVLLYGTEGQPSLLGSEGTDLLQPFPDGVRRRVSFRALCLLCCCVAMWGNPSKFDTGPPLIATPPGITTVSTDDGGDPLTTNLYVGNLSPKVRREARPEVDENFLLRTFGRFGPIASVKIMWPRTEEEHRRQRNCGFVAFMKRADAAKAKNEMDCMVVYEYEIRIGWGKAVSLPASALPAPPPGQMAVRPKELPPNSGEAVAANSAVITPNVPDIKIVPPKDPHQRHVIDTLALYVLDDGCMLEQAIMERGRGNPLFSFLFDLGSPDHTYYVWRVFSFAQGDTLQRWRTDPYIMITGSGRWIPPPLPKTDELVGPTILDKDKGGSTYAAGKPKEHSLTDKQRDKFEDLLRRLTLEREDICTAMAFALDHAEAATDIVEVLIESLTLLETPIPLKVARLMLVSDILHNSSAPVRNASAYRTAFQGYLPDVMESFNDCLNAVSGRMTAEALKDRVLKVIQRRCKHNGLSTRGGVPIMVARLLSLDAAEQAKKAAEAEAAAAAAAAAEAVAEARRASIAKRMEGSVGWSGWVEVKKEEKEGSKGDGSGDGGKAGAGSAGAAGESGGAALPKKFVLPTPELKAFGSKLEKLEKLEGPSPQIG